MSTIHIVAREASGAPQKRQRLLLQADAGLLNVSEVQTDDNGNASAMFIAPGENEAMSYVTVYVTPIDQADLANTSTRSVRIGLVGPFVPDESFTYTPTKDIVPYQFVDFDALTPEEDKVRCGSACTYSWDFGDNTAPVSGEQSVRHQFTTPGLFRVTLTVTHSSGTFGTSIKYVPVGPPAPPVADFTFGPCGVPSLFCRRFADASTVGRGATIVSYVFEFGDNSPAVTGFPVEHSYPVTLVTTTYNVRLTITDSLGRTSTVTKPVAVP